MPVPLRALASTAVAVAALAASGSVRAAECAPRSGADAVDAVRHLFEAAAKDDADGMSAVLAPDFYAFDGGKRFSGPELIALIKAAHAAGKTYVWNVTAPEVHLACDTAWVTYENRGSVGDASGAQPVRWLESAVLQWGGHGWQLRFLHSTRAPASGQ